MGIQRPAASFVCDAVATCSKKPARAFQIHKPRLLSSHSVEPSCQHASFAPSKSVLYPHHRSSLRAPHLTTMNASAAPSRSQQSPCTGSSTLLCTIATADTVAGACEEIHQAAVSGATAVELRLDFYKDFRVDDPSSQLTSLNGACREAGLVSVFTCRPDWEGGKYSGEQGPRLHALQVAAQLGAHHLDVELKAAATFFQGYKKKEYLHTKIILSSHNFQTTPTYETLQGLVREMFEAQADVAKVAVMAEDINDALHVLTLLKHAPGPTIALAMGEHGLISRLLAPKYEGYLTFGSLGSGKESAPGQPTIAQLKDLFRLPSQQRDTKVYGIVGKPVGHSRSPLLHNAGFHSVGYNAVYVPLLIESLERFLAHPLSDDFTGLSVTIPHKEEALRLADSVNKTAARIGAVNTLIRDNAGRCSAYNTDWSAAITAIEDGLRASSGAQASSSQPHAPHVDNDTRTPSDDEIESPDRSPLRGKQVVVLGAGGSARALVFGALAAGAQVTIVNRSRHRAEVLASQAGGGAQAAETQDLLSGAVQGHVLVNTTSVGMHPDVTATPVPDKTVLQGFTLVFDAIYTPMDTQLLQDAKAAGCVTVSGVEMFVGQALQQFVLFTGQDAPAGLFRELVLKGLQKT